VPVEREEHRIPDPLSELGHVEPPSRNVLENARETLWSAVAREALAPQAQDTGHAQDTGRPAVRRVGEKDDQREHRTGPGR
jgi:hypothetical protein